MQSTRRRRQLPSNPPSESGSAAWSRHPSVADEQRDHPRHGLTRASGPSVDGLGARERRSGLSAGGWHRRAPVSGLAGRYGCRGTPRSDAGRKRANEGRRVSHAASARSGAGGPLACCPTRTTPDRPRGAKRTGPTGGSALRAAVARRRAWGHVLSASAGRRVARPREEGGIQQRCGSAAVARVGRVHGACRRGEL